MAFVFNSHTDLSGEHAFLSASKYHWTNYTREQIGGAYSKHLATQRGTELHAFAKRCIELRQRLPANRKALNRFVNDAIGFRMTPEQILYYSPLAFGTADAISFRHGILRIHDLKTGLSKVSMRQLEVYSALFCLEYFERPRDLKIELRIYQKSDVHRLFPEPSDIEAIMSKIVEFDKELQQIRLEEED